MAILCIQFLLGVYGGYFGGAVGLMMVAAWGLLHGADLASMHAPRTILVTAANAIAVICFVAAGATAWPQTASIAIGALAGGYAGAQVGRRLSSSIVRAVTIGLTLLVTARFFLKAYAGWG